MLSELIEYARSSGGHCLLAVIDADNSASIALHEGFGFSRCGHLREVGYKFNRYLDLVLYQMLLNAEKS
ncbi:MAG: GNAT family N-acetyltransferase [Spirochaetia bacterium]|nr:GNAT family N-acetyltransferase [Spirochaetia bacterium]